MQNLRIPCILVLSALLGACAVRTPGLVWPDGIPPQGEFSAQWQASGANRELQSEDEYLLWVTRFYEGYTPIPGWHTMTRQVLERLPPADHERINARLSELGQRIGAEWAKDNAVRRLNSRSAGVWRDALLEALSRDELDAYLDRLAADVDALLAGLLANDAIRFERYYIDEFDC